MNVEAEIQELSEYMSPEVLVKLISKPKNLLIEDVTAVIPSLVIAGDGLSLEAIFLVTANYLCEVRIKGPGEESFDFIDKTQIQNIRVESGKQDIVVNEQVVASYETAEVILVHRNRLESELHYYGPDQNTWVMRIFEALPLEYLLHTKHE